MATLRLVPYIQIFPNFKISSVYEVAVLVWLLSRICKAADPHEVDRHLELGKELLSRGQLQDALTHFHAAIEGDPDNYLSYYRRATVYLALGKAKTAMPDLDRVIELKPDFTAARMQRGNVLLKQCRLKEAQVDFELVLLREPMNIEAQQQNSAIHPIKHDIERAKMYLLDQEYFTAIDLFSKVIEVCPWDASLRELRAESFLAVGDLKRAIGDLRPATKLTNDNTQAYYKLSQLYYLLGETEGALNEIRECLKLDPDHKECFPYYKKVKKIAASLKSASTYRGEEKYHDCVEKAKQSLKLEPDVTPIMFQAHSLLCQCYLKTESISESIDSCSAALALEEDPQILCDRADAYVANEQYDEAIHDFHKASQLDEHLRRARDGKEKTQRLQKQASKRDYYKILGVRRTANKRDVTKAYRKLAQQWHPDNFQDEGEKKKAEKKFMDIAAAKEVLTNPELRQKYDDGEDPMDPESQRRSSGFHPFHQGGSGPFHFRFHFN